MKFFILIALCEGAHYSCGLDLEGQVCYSVCLLPEPWLFMERRVNANIQGEILTRF